MNFLTQGKIGKLLRAEIKSATVAYAVSVFVLAITLAIIVMVHALIIGGESASGLSVVTRALHLLLLGIIVFVAASFFVLFMSLLPACVLIWLARKFSIHQVIVYLLTGAALALPFTAVLVDMTSGGWYTDPPDIPSDSSRCISLLPVFGFSGAFMGLTFWFFCGRYFKTTMQVP